MGAQDSKFAHTPIMTVDLEFSWPQFLWIAFIFVGVPTTIGASIIWTIWRSERSGVEHSTALDAGRTGSGPLGLWRTGLLAFALGLLSCVGWLSWSADYKGGFRGPGLPAPTQFPPWQVFCLRINGDPRVFRFRTSVAMDEGRRPDCSCRHGCGIHHSIQYRRQY